MAIGGKIVPFTSAGLHGNAKDRQPRNNCDDSRPAGRVWQRQTTVRL